ncbi:MULTISPECIES: SDR family NAD(P)-dependent oxidoreductase [unclassified Pseudomonas]|uniref:SDR family NAD(P)-dependent oxidoreductase n=1 Tax=unclassified Pseudomonas TaxID=196821 RepID=UPI00244AF466|nr:MULTISPECIES: SDR family NAD(P)-dependent oxidoreductase [unclassified Pseudomonas]MDH0303230.1 SDR family oxidoreductase [Pseudomonas sp. GD04091]MDH1987502.1 SDR family oxidoreductase [Pseudomonas sp. GD03689]
MKQAKTVLITGGARGLGLAAARALAESGARVMISDLGTDNQGRGSDPLVVAAAAAELRAMGYRVEGLCRDLTDEVQCRELVEACVACFGSLDALVHNAGWVDYQMVEQTTAQFLDRALGINVQAPLWLCKHAWPYLKQSTAPRIVLGTSDRAMYRCHARPGLAAYSAGKMAQLGLMNALAAEGAPHGILVNALSPVARTRMWGEQGEPEDLKPEWVAPGFAFLVSEACKVSGFVLRASNGQFSVARFEEAMGVEYPRDLRGVVAQSAQELAAQWEDMVRATR